MKTKMMKRAAAFAASVLMTAALAVPAAAETVKTNVSGNSPAISGNTTRLTKTIEMSNTGGEAIYEPNLTYTYTLSEPTIADSPVTITGLILGNDTDTTTVSVQSGANASGGLLLKYGNNTAGNQVELVFGDDTQPTTESTVSESFDIVTDAMKFPKPGVYRWAIQQNVDKAAAGVGEDDADVFGSPNGFIYVDAYVKAKDNGDLEVYGLVLFKAGAVDTSFEYNSETADTLKINNLDPDKYETYNVVVQKEVEGAMANKNNEFPFTVKIEGSIATAELTTAESDKGTVTEHGNTTSDPVKVSDFATAKNYTFRDGDYIQINGIPMVQSIEDTKAKVYVNETNNTSDTYSLTVKKNGSEVTEYKEILTAGNASREREYAINNETGNDTIVYTNTLDAISPTGLLFRVAPFALMMTAGGVLVAVYLRGKKREDAEEMI